MVNTVPPTAEKISTHDVATALSLTRKCITVFTRPRSMVLYTERQIECDCGERQWKTHKKTAAHATTANRVVSHIFKLVLGVAFWLPGGG